MNELAVAVSSYTGGGHFNNHVIDIQTGADIAYASSIHLGEMVDVSADHVLFHIGGDYRDEVSAAVIGPEPNPAIQYPTDVVAQPSFWGPFIRPLSAAYADEHWQIRFNSRAEDWQAVGNEALVVTWESGASLRERNLAHNPALTDLQVWDVDADRLTMLLAGGVAGQFSPNGRFVAALTPGAPLPTLQLLDRDSDQVTLTVPITVTASNDGISPDLHLAFSSDGRYLAFHTTDVADPHAVTLTLVDVEAASVVAETAARPSTPLWSPDGRRLVYRTAAGDLALLEVLSGRSRPLAASGGDRLHRPQWSFDGAYLSVEVWQADGGVVETAVLRVK